MGFSCISLGSSPESHVLPSVRGLPCPCSKAFHAEWIYEPLAGGCGTPTGWSGEDAPSSLHAGPPSHSGPFNFLGDSARHSWRPPHAPSSSSPHPTQLTVASARQLFTPVTLPLGSSLTRPGPCCLLCTALVSCFRGRGSELNERCSADQSLPFLVPAGGVAHTCQGFGQYW